jgi:hypothetical protein
MISATKDHGFSRSVLHALAVVVELRSEDPKVNIHRCHGNGRDRPNRSAWVVKSIMRKIASISSGPADLLRC